MVEQSRRERAGRLRAYFELQLMLADAMAERLAIPRGDSALRFTNLHRRLGFGQARSGASPAWRPYAAELERLGRFGERLELTTEIFAAAAEAAPQTQRFGCFSFEPPTPDGQVRIHFHNPGSADGVGPLASTNVAARTAELAAMVAHLRQAHPAANTVLGGSWLYNLEAYRRLFPPDFAASRTVPSAVRLDGTSTWGQLLDHQENVRPTVRKAFLKALPALDPAAPWLVFPLRALMTVAPIEVFSRHYCAK